VTRLLGIDLGARRIGLAVADTASGTVRRLATLQRGTLARDARALSTVTREQRIDELVVGLPLNTDGTEGAQAVATRTWAGQIAPLVGLPLRWRDERWTSEEAESALGAMGRGRSGGPPSAAARRAYRASVDQQAAALILESELAESAEGGH
jgi:putative Holliday junction resolvase